MKIKNPYFVSPVESSAATLAPMIDAWLKARPSVERVTYDELKAGIPAVAAADRAVVNHALCILKCGIENA